MSAHKRVRVYRNSGGGDFTYLWYGLLVLWALFMMDVITTEVILSSGGFEMNAVMRPFVEFPAIHIALKMAVLSVIAAVAYISDKITKRYGTIAVMAIAAWYIFVISWNIIHMKIVIL
ncbi:MAG: hypothetical protein JW931_05985 [Methanomicrobiaceae archaeon]|nr:hypothetical protein [Methanomicrobiaceae archaeon]